MIPHFIGCQDLKDQHQSGNHSSNRCLLRSVDNATMFDALCVQTQEIVVLSENDALAFRGKAQMFVIGCPKHACFRRGKDVNAALTKTTSDGLGDVFVGVILNLFSHPENLAAASS